MFFAGIEVRGWRSLRKVKDGETVDDLFAFRTCPPNAEVRAVHPKAMPVILTDPAEWETLLSAPFEIAAKLQRPLPDGALRLLPEPMQPPIEAAACDLAEGPPAPGADQVGFARFPATPRDVRHTAPGAHPSPVNREREAAFVEQGCEVRARAGFPVRG